MQEPHGLPADEDAALAGLTPDQRLAAVESERRWRRAYALSRAHPEMDPSDVYHALRCLELSVTDRLRLGLRRGRLRWRPLSDSSRPRFLLEASASYPPKDRPALPDTRAVLLARSQRGSHHQDPSMHAQERRCRLYSP